MLENKASKFCQISVRSQNLPDIQNLKFMVQHCWHLPGIAGSADCHISTTVQPFIPGLTCYSTTVFWTFDTFSLPPSLLMHSFETAVQSTHHRTLSYIICTLWITVSVLFHTVHCMCWIYGVDRGLCPPGPLPLMCGLLRSCSPNYSVHTDLPS